MTDRPTEPPLPPAYQAVHAAHQRLAEAGRQLRWRRSVDAGVAVEEERLRRLWLQLEREQADVEALESLSFHSIQSRLRRSHDTDLANERADVEAVETEIALRLDAIDALHASPGRSTVADAIQAVEQAEKDLGEAMAWWRAEHIAARSQLGLRLAALDHSAAYLHALRREMHEALDVARLASAALATARRSLASRSVVALTRREPERAKAITNAQRWLLELRAELADIGELQAPEVDGPEIVLPSLSIGPDDIFSDWFADDRVIATTISVDATLARVRRVADGLSACTDRLDAQIDAIEREARDLVLSHPGVI